MAAPSLLPNMGLLNQMTHQAANAKPIRRIVKKVSWAPEINLCQVRLFLAEDAPLQAGQVGLQEQLQAKKPWLWHAIETGIDDDLPPGFERSTPIPYRQQEVSIAPQTTWRCPPRFVINPSWQVVAGDESQEVELQYEREVRILEAVYPRPSAIPPCPAEPPESWEGYDDSWTRLIPLIPVEEEEEDLDDAITLFSSPQNMQRLESLGDKSSGTSHFADNNNTGPSLNFTGMPSYCDNLVTARVEQNKHTTTSQYNTTIEPDVAAAAAAAFVAIMRTNEEGSMIDQDLLIKILSNPQIIETLISQHIKNNNTQMECCPTSLPVNNKPNGNEFTHKFENDASSPNNCNPQVAPSVNLGTNKNRVSSGEISSGPAQPSANLPESEARVFISPELVPRSTEGLEVTNARNNKMPIASSPLPSTSGHGNSQMVSRSAMLPVTSTHAVCHIPNGVPTTTQTIISGSKWAGSQNEQYYKNLIQQHGGPNKNDHIHQNGLHYRKDLIQQHGGQQTFERGTQLQPGNMGGLSCGIDVNKAKFRKNCLYFNSPRGCRRGSSCLFVHELVDRPRLDESDMQQTKRTKIEVEISGKH